MLEIPVPWHATIYLDKKFLCSYVLFDFFQGVRIYSIQCGASGWGADKATSFWKGMADLTGGHHLHLEQFTTIIDFILAICYRESGMEQLQVWFSLIPTGV